MSAITANLTQDEPRQKILDERLSRMGQLSPSINAESVARILFQAFIENAPPAAETWIAARSKGAAFSDATPLWDAVSASATRALEARLQPELDLAVCVKRIAASVVAGK